MPKFGVIPPLVETVDQRGRNLIAGIGNANMSPLGAFIEGATRTAIDVTNIRAKQLETQRLNDPAKLMAEQVRRDLANKRLEEALRADRIDNLTRGARNQAALDAAQENTRAVRIDNQTRGAQNQANLETTRANAAAVREATETRSIQNEARRKETDIFLDQADELADLSLRERREKATSSIEQSQRQREYARRRAELNLDVMDEQLEVITKLADIESDLAKAENQTTEKKKALLDERTKLLKEERKRLDKWEPTSTDEANEKKEAEEEYARWSNLPNFDEYTDESLSPQDKKQQSLRQRTQDLMQKVFDTDLAARERQVVSQEHSISLQNKRAKESNNRVQLIRKHADNALGIAMEDRSVYGTPSIKAALPEILALAEYSKTAIDDVERTLAADSIQEIFRDLGGEEEILEYVDANVENKQARKAIKGAVYGSLVASGRVDRIKPLQQDMLAVGLSPEDIADPDEVMDDLSSLLSKKGAEVENPRLTPIRVHDYFARAIGASKNNTQGFTVNVRASEVGDEPPAADVSGGAARSYNALVFEGDDGTTLQAAVPQSPQDMAVWRILEKLGARSQVLGRANQDAMIAEKQARQTGGIQPVSAQPQQQQPTPEPTLREKFTAKVESSVAQWEKNFAAQSGRQLTPSQRQAKIQEARATLFQKLTPEQQRELQQGG